MEDKFCIAAFRSRLHVMQFERILRGAGIRATVVSTPRAVALGCGLSVRFEEQDLERVRQALRQLPAGNLIGLYSVTRDDMNRTVVRPLHSRRGG